MRLLMKNLVQSKTVSVNVRLRPSEGKESTGMGNVVLQVTIDRVPDRIPLGLQWPLKFLDKKANELLPRFPDDQQCSDYNLIIRQDLAKANELCVSARLSGAVLTHEEFKYRFLNYVSKDLFSAYMERRAKKRLEDGEIKYPTWQLHQTNARRWHEFGEKIGEPVTFSNISLGIVSRFRNWLRDDKKLEHNTITGAVKITKTYLKRAKDDKYKFDEEASKIKSSYRKSDKEALSEEEIRLLKEEYKNPMTDVERETLKKFLFMVYTGLRISDANRLNSRHIHNGKLDITQFKLRDSGKRVILHVPTYALQLIAGKKGQIFDPLLVDQVFNKTLKRIGSQLGLTKHLSSKIARVTFASILYEKSGNLLAVSEMLGHSSVRTTEIYLGLDEARRHDCIRFLDGV